MAQLYFPDLSLWSVRACLRVYTVLSEIETFFVYPFSLLNRIPFVEQKALIGCAYQCEELIHFCRINNFDLHELSMFKRIIHALLTIILIIDWDYNFNVYIFRTRFAYLSMLVPSSHVPAFRKFKKKSYLMIPQSFIRVK